MAEKTAPAENNENASQARRSFLAVIVGGLVGAVPALSGLAVFFNPLIRKSKGGGDAGNWVMVALLDAVPADGRPIRVPVITDRWDAWSHYPPEPIGSVFLRRTSEDAAPVAHTTVCPHLGCSVDYKPTQECFLCPCHNSQFTLEGARTHPAESPSPRDMDTVEVEIRNDNQVWVDYRNFKGGVTNKIEE